MSLNEIVNQLKQNYRTRYYGNRGQAIPDLKPGDNAVSFVNNYLNVTGGGNSVTQIDSSKSDNTIKKNRKQPDVTYHGLFSDEESDDGSDDEGTHLVAKLIEKSLTMNIEKPTEKLYSSDTSVVQEPPSPTSNIHAKKWLSFKNSTFAANNVFTNQVARRSEEFPNNAQQWKASNSIKENLNHADITYDLLAASSDNGPENEFVIEEENRCNIDTGVSPPKKKKLSPFPTKTKRDERTPTPKKTNSNEAFSSLQKTSKNMKASLISSTTAERSSPKVSEALAPSTVNSSEEEFEIEDISDINESNLFTIPMKAKSIQTGINKKEKVTVQKLPNKPVNFEPNNPLMPSHTEGNETLLQKDALSSDVKGIEQQPISQHAALREGSEEQAASSRVTHLPQFAGEDSENEDSIPLPVQIQVGDSDNTGSGSLNNIEPVEQPQQRRKSPRKKRDQRAEQTYGLLDETFSIKNRKDKNNSNEAFSSLHKKSKNMKASLISSTTAERLSPKVSEAPAPSTVNSSEEEFEIEDISDINESNLFTIPMKAKSIQTGINKKEKVTVQKLPNNPLMPSHTEGNETLLQKDALSSDVKGIEQQPISQHAALREGSEEQAASSRVTHLPQVAGEDSENEDSIPLPVQIQVGDSDNTGSGSLNNIEPVEQPQQRRKSPRKKRDQRAEQTYGLLDETFSIKNRKGKTILHVVEIHSSFHKTSKDVKVSPICSTLAKRLSPKVSEAPAPSTVVNSSEEEFEIEDITDIIELDLFTIPENAKSIQTGVIRKEKVTVQKLPNNPLMPSHTEGNETLLQKDALSSDVKGIEQQPISQHAALREGSEEQAASSRVTHLPQVAGEDSENEDSIPLLVPIKERDIDNTGSGGLNNIVQLQQRRKSPRKKRDQRAEQTYGLLDETFSIKNTRGKPNNIRAADKKKNNSKQLEEERKNQLDKAKKAKKKVSEKKTPESNKQRKSSKANQNELECAKDYLSNDNEAKEVKDTSATRRSSRKRNNTGEMLNADKQKNVEATVCRQPDHERLDMNSFDGQQTEEEMHIPTKERNAKLRNNGPSYPSDHSSEESVFQSGPVSRQRTVRFVEPGKPIAYDLDVPDIESGAEDEEPIVDSEKEREPLSGGPETAINISEEERAPLEDCPVIFDPESESDVLLECIAQSELSTFVGDGSCKCWTNFDNSIFTTGKLIIAPKKKNRCLLLSNIVIYYVEKGKVQLNLHKTERILKNGDFFFVPPENSCTIANLENKEAVLVFNTIKIPPLSKD